MTNQEKSKTNKYFNLSPETGIKTPVYFEALNESFSNDLVHNIAITGIYGAGKSSVLLSFIKNDNNNNYLKVSLANFCQSNNVDENKIEEHILQQLYYQLTDSNIPHSGFKKIRHLSKKEIQKLIIYVIIWLFSIGLMPKTLKLLYLNLQTISTEGITSFFQKIIWSGTLLNLIILGVFCYGLFYFLKELFIIKQKGLLKKITVKSAQIDLSEDSALNKHIDELIYFFEATSNNIVIIEDLDRFNNISLFSKLREVNYLINNSPKVNQVVKFVYAIRDDIFTNNLDRTKFFDFIIPIVPIINTTNSGDKLREFLKKENSSLPDTFINDISLYIHDLRLLKNIVNEYWIYNKVINKNNQKKKISLFSIVLYKNLFPDLFGKEHSGDGILIKAFNEKKDIIIKQLTDSKKEQIKKLEEQKKLIIAATAKNKIKLREEYIIEILKSHNNVVAICKNTINGIITNETDFNKLLSSPSIQTHTNGAYQAKSHELNFDEIQKKLDPNFSYEERVELLVKDKNNKQNKLDHDITSLKLKVSSLESEKLSELINNYDYNDWKNIILNKKEEKLSINEELLALLLRKGYIDENYQLYISHFYEGSLNLKDFEFLLNVKNNEGENFEIEITNVNELVSRITEDEYKKESALNKDLISYLLGKYDLKNTKYLSLLLSQLSSKGEEVFNDYILPLFNSLDTQKKLNRFINLLVDRHYSSLWEAIEYENYDDASKDKFLKIFLFLTKERFTILNNESDGDLKKYISNKVDFIEVFNSDNKQDIFRLIESLDIKFSFLNYKKYESNQIFSYIYENHYYEINESMLKLMLSNEYSIPEEEFNSLFYSQNFTCLHDSISDVTSDYISDNIIRYIEEVYLQLENPQKENESSIHALIQVLCNGKNSIIPKVLQKISTQIKDLEEFSSDENISLLIKANNVAANWKNLVYYFIQNENQIDDIIIKWLNDELIYKEISNHKFSDRNFPDLEEKILTSLQTQLIESNSLVKSAYEKIILSLPYIYPKISISDISSEKIDVLVSNKKIEFNHYHFDQLTELNLNDLLIKFTINNLGTFINNHSDYEFNLALHIGLIKSTSIGFADKKSILKLIPLDNIHSSELANLLGNILFKARKSFIGKNKLIEIIKNSDDEDISLKLINKFFTKFDFEDIDELLECLGGSYRKANKLRKRPTWKKTKLNLSIAQKLKNTGYFKSAEENKDNIDIVVRYS